MASVEDIINWAGYDNWKSFLDHYLDEEAKMEVFWELLANDEEMIYELVNEIGEDIDFVDYEQARADYEDAKMQEWKDKRRGID